MPSKFTPGPWKMSTHREFVRYQGIYGPNVCDLTVFGGPPDEAEANARLIAAAPELFYALKCILDELPTNRDWLDPVTEAIAKQALAKADGRTNADTQ